MLVDEGDALSARKAHLVTGHARFEAAFRPCQADHALSEPQRHSEMLRPGFEIVREFVAIRIGFAIARESHSRQCAELAGRKKSQSVVTLSPDIADTVVRIDDGKRNAFLCQIISSSKPGLSRADDEHLAFHHTTTTRVPTGTISKSSSTCSLTIRTHPFDTA